MNKIRFATTLAHKDRLPNLHAMAHGLDHIINSECRDRRPRKRFHLYAGLVRNSTFAFDYCLIVN